MFMEILDQIGAPVSSSSAPRFTERQGQYLAFIATYTLLNRRPPAEADFQRFFQVTPPAVHQMIVELEKRGLISRIPGSPARSRWRCLTTSCRGFNRSKPLRRGTRSEPYGRTPSPLWPLRRRAPRLRVPSDQANAVHILATDGR